MMECKWGDWCVCFLPELSLSPQKWRISMFYGLSPGCLPITRYAVWPQPWGRALAYLPAAPPMGWRRPTVSPESANFQSFPSSVLPSGDWKSHFSSSVATVTISCDFSYCYPVPHPREAPMLLALWHLLSGSYFLSFLWKYSQLRALLNVCQIGFACFLFFQLSLIFHFPFLSWMPLVGSQLNARSSRCCMVLGCISLT